MASASNLPEHVDDVGEDEPLLGERGDASLRAGKPLQYNFILGTAILAQPGIWLLLAVVWGAVLTHDWIFMSSHPILNSAGILFLTQAILVLQPTQTADQKRRGAYVHALLNGLGLAALAGGLVIIEINKGDHARFTSAHARIGLATYILLGIQGLVGFTMFFTPALYGGVDNAKAVWKYHRMSGYVALVLMLAAVCAATRTPYVENVLEMKMWAVVVCSLLVLVGVVPRIKKQKMGL